MNTWKTTTLVLATLSVTLFFIGADFSGESPVPSEEDRENVAPYEDKILEMEEELRSGVVSLGAIGGGGFGTGFVVHEDGYIFSNAHVVTSCMRPGTRKVRVGTKENKDYTAKVLKVADRDRVDFAVLKAEEPMPNIKPVNIDKNPVVKPEEILFSIGHPGRLGSYVITAGPVTEDINGTIEIDMPNSQGASGSPVFNMEGKVVSLLYGGSLTNNSDPAGEPIIWHGNADEYTAERITSTDSMEKAEKFFRENFNKSLADEIFGPEKRGGQG